MLFFSVGYIIYWMRNFGQWASLIYCVGKKLQGSQMATQLTYFCFVFSLFVIFCNLPPHCCYWYFYEWLHQFNTFSCPFQIVQPEMAKRKYDGSTKLWSQMLPGRKVKLLKNEDKFRRNQRRCGKVSWEIGKLRKFFKIDPSRRTWIPPV